MSNEIKKKELKDLIDAINLAAIQIIDSEEYDRFGVEQIVADLAIDALEYSIMKQYAVMIDPPSKNNIVEFKRKD